MGAPGPSLLLPPGASLGLAIVIILATETVHSLEFAVVFALVVL